MYFVGIALLFVALSTGCLALFFRNRSLSTKVEKMHEEVGELTRRRTDFVANVSHELKTPLTSIKGYTETLRDGAIRDLSKADEFLRKIEDNVQRLDLLIHDILDLSRLEATDAYLVFENFDLGSLLHSLKDQFSHRLQLKSQSLKIESQVKSMRADRQLVEQALSNLIGNANRYCPEGAQIELRSNHKTDDDGATWISLEVIDNGPGIPDADLARIFERFYRADKSRNRALGGTGLGLAIVKHIMLSHRGKASASNNLHGGTRFELLFPGSSED